jgi:ABC-type Fe3+-hydroxamate transport system substrate-binding protein
MNLTQVTPRIRLLLPLFFVALAGCTEHPSSDSAGTPVALAAPERVVTAPATTTATPVPLPAPSPGPTPDLPVAVAAPASTQIARSPAGTSMPASKPLAFRSSSPAGAPAPKGGSF